MREEFTNLYVSYRSNGLSRDEAYNAAYTELRNKYDEETVHRELDIQ